MSTEPLPEWDDLGPKAQALVKALNQFDDFYGSVIDVVVEARKQEAEQERPLDARLFSTDRDTLLEFIQWCVDHPTDVDIFDEPDAATDAVDSFLDSFALSRARKP